jgi:hypothetical protein
MKIDTNSVGNYSPYKVQNIHKTEINKGPDNIKLNTDVSKAERQFFTKLYPDETEVVQNYHFYNKEGGMKGVSLGSLLDRRG